MKPRQPATRKAVGKKRRPRPPRRLFTVRSALVFELALLAALGGVGLMLAAHRTVAQAALGGLGILGLALKLFDDLIELFGGFGTRQSLAPGLRTTEQPLAVRMILKLLAPAA